MLKLTFRITFLDGTVLEVTATAGTLVAFERKFAIGAPAALKDPHLEHMLYLAWEATRRAGETAQAFDDWIELVANIDVNPDDDEEEDAEAGRE